MILIDMIKVEFGLLFAVVSKLRKLVCHWAERFLVFEGALLLVGVLRLKHVRLETHNASASGLCRSTPSHCRWTGNLFTISQIMQEKRALRGVGSEHNLCPDRLILDM